LKAFVFDQLFEAIRDEKIAICIDLADVASAQPAIAGDRF